MKQDKHLLENTFILTGDAEIPPVEPEIKPKKPGLTFAERKRRTMLILFGDKKRTS